MRLLFQIKDNDSCKSGTEHIQEANGLIEEVVLFLVLLGDSGGCSMRYVSDRLLTPVTAYWVLHLEKYRKGIHY